MKILWITNIPIADIAKQLSTNSGLWMDALLNQLQNEEDEFIIVTSWNTHKVESHEINGIRYYLMPGGPAGQYKRDNKTAKDEWRRLLLEEKPDIIQLWGSENEHAVPALESAKELSIPSIVYIQGILKAIAHHADGHVPYKTMLRYTTLRDIYRHQEWFKQNKWFGKRAKTEKKLLSLVSGVIVENSWAEKFCKSINPNLSIYKAPLSINEEFSMVDWTEEKMVPHTILCNASGYSYKGLHELLKALVFVKDRYPDTKLYIPGRSMLVGNGLARQKVPGYWVYISDFIKKHGLQENVEFTGFLNQTDLAKLLSKTNVFVLCSAIENHSSSLKEAMTVGTPSVASLVGGVPEYFRFNEHGFSYRYGEYECLAGYVCDLFEREDLRSKFSKNGKEKMREDSGLQISSIIRDIYYKIKGQYK